VCPADGGLPPLGWQNFVRTHLSSISRRGSRVTRFDFELYFDIFPNSPSKQQQQQQQQPVA
jgi:hypothetical protein